jgi:head-tail adaptor
MTAFIDRIVTEVMVQTENNQGQQETDQRWQQKHKIEAVIKAQHERAQRISADGIDD